MTESRRALVVGASGIVGSVLAQHLVVNGWSVHGLARGAGEQPGVQALTADLEDADVRWPGRAAVRTDAECTGLADMSRSRKAGFNDYRCTPDALFALFDRLQAERIIAPVRRI